MKDKNLFNQLALIEENANLFDGTTVILELRDDGQLVIIEEGNMGFT